jgi:hypothetical protein
VDSEIDLLSEVVTHPGWKVLRRELQEQLSSYQSELLTPATDEFGLVKKEGVTYAMKGLKSFFARVEQKVDNYQKTLRRKG